MVMGILKLSSRSGGKLLVLQISKDQSKVCKSADDLKAEDNKNLIGPAEFIDQLFKLAREECQRAPQKTLDRESIMELFKNFKNELLEEIQLVQNEMERLFQKLNGRRYNDEMIGKLFQGVTREMIEKHISNHWAHNEPFEELNGGHQSQIEEFLESAQSKLVETCKNFKRNVLKKLKGSDDNGGNIILERKEKEIAPVTAQPFEREASKENQRESEQCQQQVKFECKKQYDDEESLKSTAVQSNETNIGLAEEKLTESGLDLNSRNLDIDLKNFFKEFENEGETNLRKRQSEKISENESPLKKTKKNKKMNELLADSPIILESSDEAKGTSNDKAVQNEIDESGKSKEPEKQVLKQERRGRKPKMSAMMSPIKPRSSKPSQKVSEDLKKKSNGENTKEKNKEGLNSPLSRKNSLNSPTKTAKNLKTPTKKKILGVQSPPKRQLMSPPRIQKSKTTGQQAQEPKVPKPLKNNILEGKEEHLDSLKRDGQICFGPRGISKCGLNNIAIITTDGHYTLAQNNKDFSVLISGKTNLVPGEFSCYSSIAPNGAGTAFIINDCHGKRIELFDVQTNSPIRQWEVEELSNRVVWKNAEQFVGVFDNGKISVFSIFEAAPLSTFTPFWKGQHQKEDIHDICLRFLGEEAICLAEYGRAFLVGLETMEVKWHKNINNIRVMSLGLCPKEELAIIGEDGWSQSLHVLKVDTGQTIFELKSFGNMKNIGSIMSIEFSPNGKKVAVLSWNLIAIFEFSKKKMTMIGMISKEQLGSSDFHSMSIDWEKGFMVLGDNLGSIKKLEIKNDSH